MALIPQLEIQLNNGKMMPMLGLGTFLTHKEDIKRSIRLALEIGYRHIDCASAYENESEIGKVLQEIWKEGIIKRNDIFITSKLPVLHMNPDDVKPVLKKTLADLQLSYLDLYLIHIPVPCHESNGEITGTRRGLFGLQDTWRAMEKLYDEGLVKAIGVSNYTPALINDIQNYARIVPAVNQIEHHPYLVQQDLVNFCKELGIEVVGYSPLGAPGYTGCNHLMSEEVILKLGKKYSKSPAQILIRWSLDSGVCAIPKSSNADRLKENFNVFDFELKPEEVDELNSLNNNTRIFKQDFMGISLFS
eukprot:TRINITY_DN9849_c0_g1_i1.p1 TRINITY_DN9849_c0_g1~~TRINITY_DN9849_c0_g1_i1.p1  ORF type:complete len:304 (+),score=38.18 TRINITY_DN9849_c0_g1_i1:17-928(+)